MTTFFRKAALFVLVYISFFLYAEKVAGNEFENLGNPIIGLWQTTLNDKGATSILVLEIKSTETDSLECLINLPECGLKNLPYGKFIMEVGNFELPGLNASYDADNQLISGIFTALGSEDILEFERFKAWPKYTFNYPEKEIDWTFQTDAPIWSPLTIFGGQLILGNDGGSLYSINIEENSISWIFKTDSRIRSKAVVWNHKVYFSSDDGFLYSLDFENGEMNWKTNIGNNVSPRSVPALEGSTYDFLCSSPVIDNGILYIGSIDSCLYAIDDKTGDIKWKYKSDNIVRSTPAVDSDNVYFGSWDNYMYAINKKDGSLNWKQNSYWRIQSSPVIADDKIIFGSRSAQIIALDKNTGEQIWRTLYWSSWVESSPVYYDGMIYVGSSDYRKVHAIDPENGEVAWEARIEGWAWPTPALSDKYLYIGSSGTLNYAESMHGRFYAVNRLNGNIEWKVSVDDNPDVFAYGFVASPVVWDNWVFFADLDGKIYGIKEE
jgi:outer membrane protein assembly factor BamB